MHHHSLKWLPALLACALTQCVPMQLAQMAGGTGTYSPNSLLGIRDANRAKPQRLLYPGAQSTQPAYGQQYNLPPPLPTYAPQSLYNVPPQTLTKSTQSRATAPRPRPQPPTKPITSSSLAKTSYIAPRLQIQQRPVSPRVLGHTKTYAMDARYITIHSTGNTAWGAQDFASQMERGKLISTRRTPTSRAGHLSWHYTVDDSHVIQHLAHSVQGGHADFNGPGNKTSIGIEMCEDRGNDLPKTIERTARLAAHIMVVESIPLSHVVPHYHWARPGQRPTHKCCPHFLMERNGQPGPKWQAFRNRVAFYHSQMSGAIAAR